MDVPFHSSGALSRAHYAIVRKVETSSSVQSADQHLFLEIKSIQDQLLYPKFSPEKCKEYLIILLYCSTSVTTGFLPADAFDFAFHHAINLAETGRKVEDKRIGYLFCAEVMPLDHELRIMLINTLRKDLESDDAPHICLALDNLISSPTEDVIPAVQSRLHDLLSHDFPHVRRRALLAFRALSKHNSALLDRIHGSVLKRLKDADSSVVQAALVLARTMSNDVAIVAKVNDLLVAESAYINDTDQDIILSILRTLRSLRVLEANIPLLFDILQEYSEHENPTPHSKAIIHEIFLLFSQISTANFLSAQKSKDTLAVQCIRHFLVSHNSNDVYLFLSCLKCVDVDAWAGVSPDHPAALEKLEFERIMQLLNFPDQGLRRMTMRIIKKVDTAILDGHVMTLMKGVSTMTIAPTDENDALTRVLETRFIQCNDDGGEYAHQILQLLQQIDNVTPEPRVMKSVIEIVLTDIRIPSNPDFLSSCATHFITVLSESDVPLGPTALVISTALTTEFCGSVPTSPLQILSGLAARLKTCPAVVQEPCIIAMLRVRAECDDIPSDALETITTLAQSARKSIRSRCSEFLHFVQDKEGLLKIIREADSPSLPGFLLSLQTRKNVPTNPPRSSASTPRPSSRTSSHASTHTSSSLRYAAYAPPEVIPPLRTRRASSSQSIFGSPPKAISDSDALRGSTSPPMSAGHLALAAGIEDLELQPSAKPLLQSPRSGRAQLLNEGSRMDLISLESPFEEHEMQPFVSSQVMESTFNFEEIWSSFNTSCDLRGWCNVSIDTATRRLQRVDHHHLRVISADVAPFVGELKILMVPNKVSTHTAKVQPIALRLRESEEDSCLWRLRCTEVEVATYIEGILNA
ncbi:ARM repeat-containing protein [Pholiota conissans]|uniref:ARM repeat-containing protein n=1 Tax=Pholiota conissans TaxID=109636 RepID=A0A9P5YSX9_9AGAR|nr:ARM repeat-containing protein [Pholiota conissans]